MSEQVMNYTNHKNSIRKFGLRDKLGYLLMFLVLFFLYPMTQEALKEIQDELERRRTSTN